MKDSSRKQKSVRNILWGVIFKCISLVLPFVNRTIIIRFLGIEYTGISNLFTSILSVLSLAELGINSAILFSIYKTIAENDVEKTNAYLSYYKKAYRYIGIIVLSIGLIICCRLEKFIAGDYPKSINIYYVFIIYLLNSVLSYFFFSYVTIILVANQREDIVHRISLSVMLLGQVVQLCILYCMRNFYLYIFISLLTTVSTNFVSFIIVRKIYPAFFPKGSITLSERKSLKKQIAGLVIGKLSVVSRNSFDSVIISSTLGLTATAIYGNYYYIMSSVIGIIFAFCSGIRASIGNKLVTNTVEENFEDMLYLSYAFYIIYGTCTTILLCTYQSFMYIWVGSEYTGSIYLAVFMSVYFFIFCSVGVISQYWEAAGLFWENRIRYIVESIANLLFDIILVKFWGMNGVVLATIISMLFVTNIAGPIIAFRYYFKNCAIIRFYLQQIQFLLATIITCSVSFFLCRFITIQSFFCFMIKCIISAFVALLLNLLLFYNTSMSKQLRNKIFSNNQ